MRAFVNKMERLISLNRIEQAIDSFMESLSSYNPTDTVASANSKELKSIIIGLSQRLHQVNDNMQRGISSEEDLQRERRSVSNNLLDLINNLSKYPTYASYLLKEEEEDAWRNATKSNNIQDYQSYFDNYPNGKYRDQTKRVIEELKQVEERKEQEMKRLAELERKRRERVSAFTDSNPPKTEPEVQQPPQGAYGQGNRSNLANQGFTPDWSSGNSTLDRPAGHKKFNISLLYFIIAHVATAIIPFIGLGLALFIRFYKTKGEYRFDEVTRTRAILLLVLAIIWWIVWMIVQNMNVGSPVYNDFYY